MVVVLLTSLFISPILNNRGDNEMVAVTLAVVCVASFAVGWIIADALSDKRFWERQNYMEKLNRKF